MIGVKDKKGISNWIKFELLGLPRKPKVTYYTRDKAKTINYYQRKPKWKLNSEKEVVENE